MKYKAHAIIRGSICRPSYDGTVEISDFNIACADGDLRRAVYRKLKASSFPEIRINDVVVDHIEMKGGDG